MNNEQWIVEEAIEYILKWTREDAELASQVANMLASLDWNEAIIQKKQKKIDSRMWAMKNFIE
jgi:hypothetical protein